MPCTRFQAKQKERESHPPPSVHDIPRPSKTTQKKPKKSGGKGVPHSPGGGVAGPSKSQSGCSSNPAPFVPPPRPSIEELKKLFRPPPYDVLRAAASAKQSREAQSSVVFGPEKPTKCTPPQQRRWEKIFTSHLEENAQHYANLIEAANSFADTALCSLVQSIIDAHPDLPPPALASGFISWLLNFITTHPSLPDCLARSKKERQKRRGTLRTSRRNAAANYRVFRTPLAYAQFHFTVVHLWLSALPDGEEYPPRAHWLVESQEVYDMCVPFLENQKLADSRNNRFPVHFVQRERLQYVVPEGLTCLIYDRKAKKLVASVVRNFSQLESLLEWVSRVVGEGVDTRRSIRLEDSGSIVLIGFSAGSRSRPLFGLARNLLRKSTDTSAADVNNAAASAYMWKHTQMLHPREVSDSIEEFYKEYNFPWLDPGWPYSRSIAGDIASLLSMVTCSPSAM